MFEIRSRPLFEMEIHLHPLQELGATPNGKRIVAPVSGGTFRGDRLSGLILPHAGSDWILFRADGSVQLDVRMTLQTDDGALIAMCYRGVRRGSPEVMARLAKGERVDPSEYYLRTAPFFETAAAEYGWLNTIVTVGLGERLPNGAAYRVFEIL